MDRTRERQFTEWLDLVGDLMAVPLGGAMPRRAVIEQLVRTFGCHVAWNEISADGVATVEWPTDVRAPDDPGLDWWRREGPAHHPLVQWFVRTGDPLAQTLGRVPAELVPERKRRVLVELIEPMGVAQQLSIPCRMGRTDSWSFVLGRNGPDFSDGELAAARRIQPLLALLARQASVRTAPPDGDGGLTPREIAVLVLLSQGLTAAAIASRLATSERTVHKHLEHIYRKLGVNDRLMAFQIAREAGLLPGDRAT